MKNKKSESNRSAVRDILRSTSSCYGSFCGRQYAVLYNFPNFYKQVCKF
ncbi:hypothetical protein CLOSTHATH_04674 [Hungatella hathewayi DSM 13479]|uniref:Uncharacterized protein n=1 Tax=Hungatella hathewayi DSM 13479 TaxID=566550 RepID=D3AM24_9FIRM|nr:hypothetical protein CLOSTHATH_04674 [Hungatella hathewayi DSM 13479]